MWLSDRALRPALLGIMLVLAAGIAGCTLTPVYSAANIQRTAVQLAYAAPANRIEQIIYQDLGLRFAPTSSATAPLVTVSAASSGQSLALSVTVNPAKPYQANVSATLTLTPRDGNAATALTLVRTASAGYTNNSQAEANAAAFTGAAEQAAHAVAEQLRLALLASLSR